MSVLNWIVENYQAVISIAVGLLSSVVAIALLVPGDEPEKSLQKVVDFISKLSKK